MLLKKVDLEMKYLGVSALLGELVGGLAISQENRSRIEEALQDCVDHFKGRIKLIGMDNDGYILEVAYYGL